MAVTGNPLLDDADSGDQTFDHPTADNPLLTDADTSNRSLTGAPAGVDTGPTGLMSRGWVSLADVGKQPSPPSDTPIRDLARSTAAAVERGIGGVGDIVTNPAQLGLRPLGIAGGAAWDWLAPKFGGSPMTKEQRDELAGIGNVPPEQQGVGTRLMQSGGQAIGADPYTTAPPRTPTEAAVAAAVEGAIPGMVLGPLGRLGMMRGGILGGTGAVAGGTAAQYVPDQYKPITELAVNALTQGGLGYISPRTGAGIDPAVADIARTGRQEGIPFSAPDITPGSRFRTPEQQQFTADALQGNMLSELNLNPKATGYRITPDAVSIAKGDAAADMRSITNTNDIGQLQAFRLRQQLQQAQNTIDTTAGITDADRAQMRARIAEINGAINYKTGRMAGTDYQSLTNTDSPLDRLAGNANPDMANIGRGLMRNLDQAFRASLSPEDGAFHTDARYRYRLASTLDPLADKYQGKSLPMNEVADALYGAQQKYGSVPGSQLDRFMSQAGLIAGGPTPYAPSAVGNVLSNPLPAALGLSTGSFAPVAAQVASPVVESLLGIPARSSARTSDVIAAAMDPLQNYGPRRGMVPSNPQLWRLRQALAAILSAGVR